MSMQLQDDRAAAPFRREPLAMPAGNAFARLVTAQALASHQRIAPQLVVERLWPSDKLVLRAASAPAMTSAAGWAQELARKVVTDGLAALGAAAAGAALLQAGTVLTFDGAGSISVPGFVAAAGNAGFVGEGMPIPVRQLSSSAALLQPYKLAAVSVMTREMMESSNAEQLISGTLVRAMGLALDAALFDSNAATAARPAGLRAGIAALTASTSTDMFEAALEDFTALVNSISVVGGNGQFIFVMSAGRSMAIHGRLWKIGNWDSDNFTILASAAAGLDIIAVAPAALVSAFDPTPDVQTSNSGELHMNDTPLAIVNGGAPAAPARSLFQTESIATKIRWPLSWALRDSRGVAWLTPTWK
jgi:Phage capsid family